jgi:CRP-like cAMP-binding protein
VYKEGEVGRAMYIIEKGAVVLSKYGIDVTTYRHGKFFGEREMLSAATGIRPIREQTVRAWELSELQFLTATALNTICADFPELRARVIELADRRLAAQYTMVSAMMEKEETAMGILAATMLQRHIRGLIARRRVDVIRLGKKHMIMKAIAAVRLKGGNLEGKAVTVDIDIVDAAANVLVDSIASEDFDPEKFASRMQTIGKRRRRSITVDEEAEFVEPEDTAAVKTGHLKEAGLEPEPDLEAVCSRSITATYPADATSAEQIVAEAEDLIEHLPALAIGVVICLVSDRMTHGKVLQCVGQRVRVDFSDSSGPASKWVGRGDICPENEADSVAPPPHTDEVTQIVYPHIPNDFDDDVLEDVEHSRSDDHRLSSGDSESNLQLFTPEPSAPDWDALAGAARQFSV